MELETSPISDEALPSMPISGSCVRPSDFDDDGDLDLFIGGRLIPGRYPEKPNSYILRNESEKDQPKFTNVTREVCKDLNGLGLVTDALWTDFNGDEQIDLVVVGEWMSVTFFANEDGKLRNMTDESGVQNKLGWWRSIEAGDFDNDGDIDFVVGNEGLNSWFKASDIEPLMAYSSDFDNDGRYDVVLTSYQLSKDGTRKAFPVHFKSDLGKQMEMMKGKFTTYALYSEATIEDLFSEKEIENALKSSANWMANSYIENLGNSQFTIRALPTKAQLAPINDFLVKDINDDGNLDLLVVGNNHGNSVFWGPMDAFNGLVMLGDGSGDFQCVEYPQSGFFVPGDGRDVDVLELAAGSELVITSQNQDHILVFQRNSLSNGSNADGH